MGSNNFQVGSLVIRLRTCGKNGRPILDDSQDAPNIASDDTDSSTEDDKLSIGYGVSVEATALPENSSSTQRDCSMNISGVKNTGQRRNTVSTTIGRKHSPSTASAESAPGSLQTTRESKESIQQLNEQLESINQERDKMTTEMTKEVEDFNIQFAEICRIRDEKKIILKEQEEASEKLRKEVNTAERLNRQAQTRKSQKEKLLKERLAEQFKMAEDMKRWKKEIEDMKSERTRIRGKREKVEKRNQVKEIELKDEIKQRQIALNLIEEEIRIKGLQIKELEKHHKSLTSSDEDEEARLRDEYEDREWDSTEKAMTAELNAKSQQLREIGTNLQQQQAYLSTLQQRSSMICHGYFPSHDYDATATLPLSESLSNCSRNSGAISPAQARITLDSPLLNHNSCNGVLKSSFAPGPYIQMGGDPSAAAVSGPVDDMAGEDFSMLTAGAPLSPTATSLLPSNIFSDDESSSPSFESLELPTPALPTKIVSFRNHDPQSPSSPTLSAGLLSRPQNHAHLPKHSIQDCEYAESDQLLASPRPNFSAVGSVGPYKPANQKVLRDLFSLPRPKPKELDQGCPPLGSLKPCQSHSFSRLSEDVGVGGSKPRRIVLSSGLTGFLHKNFTTRESLIEGDVSTDIGNSFLKRSTFEMYDSIMDDQNPHDAIQSSSPHSRSVVSFDLPRPSTHSAPFGWGPVQDQITDRNGHLSADWSLYSTNHNLGNHQSTWSSGHSKRISSQLSSSDFFLSRNAHKKDELSPSSDNLTCQSSQSFSISPIGTRKSSNLKTSPPKLNPAAPVFKGFKINCDSKIKIEKGKNCELMDTASLENINDEFPNKFDVSASLSLKKTHDASSIHTKNSLIESFDGLDHQNSKAQSEMIANLGTKEKEESSFQRLFRKSSSSKFSISSFRGKDSGIFSAKKSVTVASDENDSLERVGSIDGLSGHHYCSSYDSVNSSPIYARNDSGECTKVKDKDPLPKDGKLSMSWGRFGIKSKKGKENLGITDFSEDMMMNSEI